MLHVHAKTRRIASADARVALVFPLRARVFKHAPARRQGGLASGVVLAPSSTAPSLCRLHPPCTHLLPLPELQPLPPFIHLLASPAPPKRSWGWASPRRSLSPVADPPMGMLSSLEAREVQREGEFRNAKTQKCTAQDTHSVALGLASPQAPPKRSSCAAQPAQPPPDS